MSDKKIDPLDGAARLIADAAAIPDRPVGPHLREDQVSRLALGTMTASDQESALAHVESCMRCAEKAEQAFGEIELAHDHAGSRAETTATSKVDAEAIAREVLQLAWLPVIAVAALQTQRLRSRGLATRGSDVVGETLWKHTSEPSLLCALEDLQGRVTLSLRTGNADWAETPVRCVVQDDATGQIWSEAWLLLHRHPSGNEYGDAAELESQAGPLPDGVRVTVGKCELNPRSAPAPGELASLRRALAKSAGTARTAWLRWLDQQVASGLMADHMRARLLPAP